MALLSSASVFWSSTSFILSPADFRELYTAYLDRLDTSTLSAVLGRAVAVGHIDYYNRPIRFFNRVSQSWLRSSFLFIPTAELRLLGTPVSGGRHRIL